MSDDDAPDSPPVVHRLDVRQAELGRDLRRMFETVLDEPIPDDLVELTLELEAKLAAREDPDPAGDTVVPLRVDRTIP